MRTMALCVGMFLLPVTVWAEKAEEKAAPSSVKAEDCGAYMKAKAPLPKKLSELVEQVALNMDAHAKWMSGNKDKASKAELKFVKKMAKDHHALAALAKKIAAAMASVSLEAAPHDMAKMPPEVGSTTAKMVTLSKEMSALLKADAAATEKMMAQPKTAKK
ncbi:MAG: hypothetical protein IT371_25980 [Deltaproteobacteria bacterium]|nr:hypothetical protein [Deltaproteobacteria bacterium]